MYKLWVNIDDAGNITNAYGGVSVSIINLEMKDYQYYFEVSDEVFKNIGSYKVVNGNLILK